MPGGATKLFESGRVTRRVRGFVPAKLADVLQGREREFRNHVAEQVALALADELRTTAPRWTGQMADNISVEPTDRDGYFAVSMPFPAQQRLQGVENIGRKIFNGPGTRNKIRAITSNGTLQFRMVTPKVAADSDAPKVVPLIERDGSIVFRTITQATQDQWQYPRGIDFVRRAAESANVREARQRAIESYVAMVMADAE